MNKEFILKKIIILIILLPAIIVFSGCVRKQPIQQKNINKHQQQKNQNLAATTSPQNPKANTSTTTTAKNNEIDTSNWKVYRNKKYGYEIKYLNDWSVFDNNPNMPPYSSVQFNDYISNTEGALLRIDIPEYGSGAEMYQAISAEEINLSGVKAKKYFRKILNKYKNFDKENSIYISFRDKKFGYESGILFKYSTTNKDYYLNIFNKMINSFKFY